MSERLLEALNSARAFIQASLTNGHLSGGDVGNLMGARDEIDVATMIVTREAASPTGRQLGPGKRDELPPIVSEGDTPDQIRKDVARLVEPSAWSQLDKIKNPWGWARYPNGPRIVWRSLAKADAIIALLRGEARSALSKATGEGG